MRNAGRTVVLVSHDLDVVSSVCDRVMVLAHGEVALIGAPAEVISRYRSDPTLARRP
jgi:ABC-type polysaccharide/polyol phosphate transport system ATPase subunit